MSTIKILFVVVACFFSAVVAKKSLRDLYFLDRLQLTDKTLLSLVKRVEALERVAGIPKSFCAKKGWNVLFDFENGLDDWTLTGKAFNNQPTYGDNPTARKRGQPSNHRGNWWIGGYENRPSPTDVPGLIQGDKPQGTMTSPPFVIRGSTVRFLIGGGCNIQNESVDLLIEGQKVLTATGKCNETMVTKKWNVSSYIGKTARLRLVDSGSGGWEHINFDQFEMYCDRL